MPKQTIDAEQFDSEIDRLRGAKKALETSIRDLVADQLWAFGEQTGGAVVDGIRIHMIDTGTMAGADARIGYVSCDVVFGGVRITTDD